jgi:hypothetical protein
MILIAPEQPKPAPPSAPVMPVMVVDHFDHKLVESIGQPDNQPVPLWPVIHEIVKAEQPVDRTQRRRVVGRLLCRTRSLLRRGVLVREGKDCVRVNEPVKPPVIMSSKPVKNLPPSPYITVAEAFTFYSGGPSPKTFKV